MQKEWFSAYVFEDLAAEILANDPGLQQQLDLKKLEDDDFANDPKAQLLFVYYHSEYYEKTHNLYPIFRIEQEVNLPKKYE